MALGAALAAMFEMAAPDGSAPGNETRGPFVDGAEALPLACNVVGVDAAEPVAATALFNGTSAAIESAIDELAVRRPGPVPVRSATPGLSPSARMERLIAVAATA
jgi:hypothetical protein